jgi:hypothetical protein
LYDIKSEENNMPFFLDDGTEINPGELEIPDKCLKCKKYTSVNIAEDESVLPGIEWEVNVFCILNRIEYLDRIGKFSCRDYIYNPDWKPNVN